jgi:hypothetical protein
MYLKFRLGLLPTFQPYQSLQFALARVLDSNVHPIVPWALSFLNGSAIVSVIFGRVYHWLPGKSGATKGLTFGVLGWIVMGLVFFPLIGLGPFAAAIGLGLSPALFSLAMFLAYSVVLGIVYGALKS